MIRRSLVAGALLALAACGSSSTPTVTIGFRQPSALAVYRGLTRDDPAQVRPYLAVANAARNDLTILDATDDTVVQAPVQLRALVLPVAERPALLVAASLGDDDPADPLDGADLLVAVSAGDSVLQVVNTWEAQPAVAVFTGEVAGSPAVDLGGDVVAIAALPPDPSEPGVARVAAALTGGKMVVVRWKRAAEGGGIELESTSPAATLGFQPIALAAMPDDGDPAALNTAIYAATRDPLPDGSFGVAEISLDLATVRPLDARGPTRLVAAARVRERGDAATAMDASAFDLASAPTPRVYAVLDESGCGLERPIPCGVVTVDPGKASPDPDYIPEDWAGRMPYRAPIAIPGRPLALAVSPPPVAPPSAEAADAAFAGDTMRVHAGAIPEVTTGVGLVASDDGRVYFLDLGRFRAVTASAAGTNTLRGMTASVLAPSPVTTTVTTPEGDVSLERRLWIQDAAGAFVPDLATGVPDLVEAAKLVGRTPGWTRTAPWSATWQGELPLLSGRAAEAGPIAADRVWLALQAGSGTPPRLSQVVKLWHPALGVQAGDVAVLKAAGVPTPPPPQNETDPKPCVGTRPPGTAEGAAGVENEFEVEIGALLAPSAAYPGGALELVRPDATAHPEWATCFDTLVALMPTDGVVPRLTATIRAGEFVVTSGAIYAGRPVLVAPGANSWTYAFAYPVEGEDALAALDACPLIDWDGAFPVETRFTCGGGACDRVTCERALLARKARRAQNNFEDCTTADAPDGCADAFSTVALPTGPAPLTLPAGDVEWPGPAVAPGPVVSFRFGVQAVQGDSTDPVRGLSLVVSTNGGEAPMVTAPSGSPYRASSAIAFDRSIANPAAGYRFFVSYTGDTVLDVSPHVTPTDVVVLR